MGKQWPHEEVKESGFFTYPAGPLKVKVKSQEDAETKSGLYKIHVETRVLAPAKFKNQPFNFDFVIGMTEATIGKLGLDIPEDIEANNAETWLNSPSARRYQSFLKACEVPHVGDTDEEAEGVKNRVIFIDVGARTDENSGRTYNDTNAFYPESASLIDEAPKALSGARPVRPNGQLKAAPAAATRTARPAAKPAAAVEPAGDDWEN